MNIESSYRIELKKQRKRERNILVQYIEAPNMDAAIAEAKQTFAAGLYNFKANLSVTAQKACPFTKLRGLLSFEFKGERGAGCITLDVTGMTIFQAYQQAVSRDFVGGGDITEILTPSSYFMR